MASPSVSPSLAVSGASAADPSVTFWAPLLVGLLVGIVLWILTEGVRAWVRTVSLRRARRRQIISLMGRAVALQARAVHDGRFEVAWITASESGLTDLHERYDDLTAQALDLFEPGEEAVAFWTMAEFYAGWYAPFQWLEERGVPRAPDPEGHPLVAAPGWGWNPARPGELAEWARVKWPWDRGDYRGPVYADMFSMGDISRHAIVKPNTDGNVGLIWPYVLYLERKPRRGPLAKLLSWREKRRLEKRYANDQYHTGTYLLGGL